MVVKRSARSNPERHYYSLLTILKIPIRASGRSAWYTALCALTCAVLWVGFNVSFNYGNHISGLFYTGARVALPAEIENHTRRLTYDDIGYDAHFYHLIAHDPLLRRGSVTYLDNPSLRWRRIGVPGLAALLTFGNDDFVDTAYLAIELIAVFAGAFWLSRYSAAVSWPPAFGLAFLLVPATLVSIDRMTIDLPLAAICVGLALHERMKERVVASASFALPAASTSAMLISAALFRETGIMVVAAWCCTRMLRKQLVGAVACAACAIPALAWWLHVDRNVPADGTTWIARFPFSGLIDRTLQGMDAASGRGGRAAPLLEELALLGIWLAVLSSIDLIRRKRFEFLELTAILFVCLVAVLGTVEIWASAYATGRTMSPLLLALGLIALRDRRPVLAVPTLLILPRIALQYAAEIRLALR